MYYHRLDGFRHSVLPQLWRLAIGDKVLVWVGASASSLGLYMAERGCRLSLPFLYHSTPVPRTSLKLASKGPASKPSSFWRLRLFIGIWGFSKQYYYCHSPEIEILLLLVKLRLEEVKLMFFLSLRLHSLKNGKYIFLLEGDKMLI